MSDQRSGFDEDSNRVVYDRILAVIHSGLLVPGQRLPEPSIARIIGVSRERVRRALHRLAHEGWLQLIPNKGACIPEFDLHEITQAFQARRLIETTLVRELAERGTPLTLRKITAHLKLEAEARREGNRSRQVALSYKFHEELFDLLDNKWMSEFFRQVQVPTVGPYAIGAAPQLPECGGPHDHQDIVEAIRQGDAEKAAALMDAHIAEAMIHIRSFRNAKKSIPLARAFELSLKKGDDTLPIINLGTGG